MRHNRRLALLCFMIALPAAPRRATAAANGLGQKAYMGWSSWSLESTKYPGYGSAWLTEANVKRMSDAMQQKLQPFGYTYINIDSFWGPRGFDGNGRPKPDFGRFPSGISGVASYVHAKGQKLGLYWTAGLRTEVYDGNYPILGTSCHTRDIAYQPLTRTNSWKANWAINWSHPCAQAYVDSVASLFASWGVDFLKLDGVTPTTYQNIGASATDNRGDVKAWSAALIKTGRPIWFTISWSLDRNYVSTWKQYANAVRIDTDVECYCGTIVTWTSSVDNRFADLPLWQNDLGPGSWPDLDAVDVGVGAMDGLSNDERRSTMTLWAINAGPLYSGDDLTKLDSYGLSLLTNTEVLAVNQAARPARPLSTSTAQQVWRVQNADGSWTVALFNLGSSAANVTANWSDLGWTGAGRVRDLWSKSDLGTFNDRFTASVPTHGTRLLKVTAGGTTPTPTATPTPRGTPTATPPPGSLAGYYRILARHSGKAVVVQSASTANGANVFQWSYTSATPANDEWLFTDLGAGYYRIDNRNSGRAMVVQGASTADGGNVIQWAYTTTTPANDEWQVVSLGTGYYRFVNRNSGRSLDVSGASTADGANVIQWSWSGGTNQQFQLLSTP